MTSDTPKHESTPNAISEDQETLRSRQIVGTPRQIADGGLLGTCFLFLAAMLGLPRLDTPLTVALMAFVSAIPLLVWGFMNSTIDFEGDGLTLRALKGIGWAAYTLENLGYLDVAVGVVALIAHLSGPAVVALVATFAFIVLVTISVGRLFVWAGPRGRRRTTVK